VEVPWRQTAENRLMGEIKRCKVVIDLQGASVDLPVKEVLQAFWHSHPGGIVLDTGKTVHDYLR
jgi:hypothetical protein